MIIKIIIALILYDTMKFLVTVFVTARLKDKDPELVKKTFDERIAEVQAKRNKL
jgi:hypothetical protein